MTGVQLKLRGMRLASEKHRQALLAAKVLAQFLAGQWGRPISVEDIYSMGFAPKALQNAAGSIFLGAEWERVSFVKAARPAARARYISTWRMKNGR